MSGLPPATVSSCQHISAIMCVLQVLKALGKGSYGTVYKVQRMEDGGVYAMKETDLTRMGAKERQDAVNEIRVLGSMKHPNVVKHHETFVSGGQAAFMQALPWQGLVGAMASTHARSRTVSPLKQHF